jgi:hypothetical protein
MNIRKIMGRLNAKACSFDGGRGGIPEFSPAHIAAAVGAADEIGREIFCFAWWPDGARLQRDELHKLLRDRLMSEFSSRYSTLSTLRLSLHMLQSSERKHGAPSRAMLAAEHAVYEAEDDAWPKAMEKYDEIVDAVLVEICTPRHCQRCHGRGEIIRSSLKVKCDVCNGRGLVGISKAWRARKLGLSEAAYRAVWRKPYEYLYEFVAEQEYAAAEKIKSQLFSNENSAAEECGISVA